MRHTTRVGQVGNLSHKNQIRQVTNRSYILAWILLGLAVSPARGQEEAGPRFIRPADGTTVTAGLLEIAVLLPDPPGSLTLTLDGRAVAPKALALGSNSGSEPSGGSTTESLLLRLDPAQLAAGLKMAPVWVVVRNVAPGAHELTFGPARVRFQATTLRMADIDTTAAFNSTSGTLYSAHPMTVAGMLSCTACHQLNREAQPPRFDDMSTITPPETPAVCFRCHPEGKFLPDHAHRVEHLQFCQMCHDPHGASRPKLMKVPRHAVCKKCHE